MKANSFLASWAVLPLGLALALGGQVLLLFGLNVGGALLYLCASGVLILGLYRKEGEPATAAPDLSREKATASLLVVLLAALALRSYLLGAIPWGLNNDEGIEGLIACHFLSGVPITPFSDIGISRETLFHVLLLPIFRFFGPGILSLRSLSVGAGVASVALTYFAGKELFSRRVGLFAAAALSVSPWHLLYSRTGLRNILVPVFLLTTLGLYHRALEKRLVMQFLLTGVVLGTGMYSYTSFRLMPLVLTAWSLLRRWVLKRTPMKWREVLAVAVPFVALLTPQLIYALKDPGILVRGNYVLEQTPQASYPANLLYSFLMPVVYPARFGVVQSRYYFGDGVSLVYAAVGRTPETVVSAALMACGFILVVVRLFRRRTEGEGILLLLFLVTVGSVGVAGPSLTRLISNLPILCLMGALFLEEIFRSLRHQFRASVGWGVVWLLLLTAAVLGYDQFFNRAGRSGKAMDYYAYPQTVMGLYAASRPPDHPVFVFYTEQPEALQFLTYPRRGLTPLYTDPAKLDLEKIRSGPQHLEIVMQNHRRFLELFRTLAEIFPGAAATALSDPLHNPDRKVAYVLEITPASVKPPSEETLPSGLHPSPLGGS